MRCALSDERTRLSFTIAAGLRQRSHSLIRVPIIFYCLKYETTPTWRARSPYLYPPGTGWPSYIPRHWVPFSSPPTTSRTKVVFEAASARDELSSRIGVFLYALALDRGENAVRCCTTIVSVGTCLFAKALVSNGCVCLLIKNVLLSSDVVSWSLPSNGSAHYNTMRKDSGLKPFKLAYITKLSYRYRYA
jgi:hypothetical protein